MPWINSYFSSCGFIDSFEFLSTGKCDRRMHFHRETRTQQLSHVCVSKVQRPKVRKLYEWMVLSHQEKRKIQAWTKHSQRPQIGAVYGDTNRQKIRLALMYKVNLTMSHRSPSIKRTVQASVKLYRQHGHTLWIRVRAKRKPRGFCSKKTAAKIPTLNSNNKLTRRVLV